MDDIKKSLIWNRFWEKVDKEGPFLAERELGRCWVWTGAKNNEGYGTIRRGSRVEGMALAHVISYELIIGPVPDGLQIDHLCENTSCVRPNHLEAVTGKVNTLRGNTITSINAEKTHCPKGHLYSPENTYHYDGKRSCRRCKREKQQERAIAKRRAVGI